MTNEYRYRYGSNVLAESGHIRAFGDRILVRAILEQDWYDGKLHMVEYNTVEAIAFEIVSIGPGVSRALGAMGEDPISVGDHIDIKCVSADRVNGKDSTGRYWLVQAQDIVARIDRVSNDEISLSEAIARHLSNSGQTTYIAPPNGEVTLEAAG